MSQQDPVVVWGGGAIGGTIAAYWARAGVPVLLVDVVQAHVEACRTRGLRIEGSNDNFTVVVPSATPAELRGMYSRIVLAVKAQATEQAVDALAPHLSADGYVLSAQNGLNEKAIAQKLGAQRTMGCFVNFGSDWLEPGRILYGGRGEVVVGEIDGAPRERTKAMHELLKIFEPNAILTDNIWGYLWAKLGFAAMLFATSINNDGMDPNFADPKRFPVWDRLGREVMRVAAAEGIRPMPLNHFDPSAFMEGSPESAARKSVEILSTRRKGAAKQHSGFWRDLAVRKRKTEVDHLMGPVLEAARRHGIAVPAVQALVDLVHAIEQGRRELSWDTFQVLLDVCEQQPAAA
jgi:2-dehydropantoate 2-reductase